MKHTSPKLQNVVVDCSTASEMIYNLYKKQNQDLGSMKTEIVALADNIIADDVKKMDINQEEFFKMNDINIDTQLQVVPESLQILLRSLKSRRSKAKYRLKYASISRHHMPPMMVALGAEI